MLCEFRTRLTEQVGAAYRLLQLMLDRLVEASLLKAGSRQRIDAAHVLAAVRTLSHLELVGETLRAALEELAEAAPAWLAAADRAGVGQAVRAPGGDRQTTGREGGCDWPGRGVRPGRTEDPHRRLGSRRPTPPAASSSSGDSAAGLVHHYYWDAHGLPVVR